MRNLKSFLVATLAVSMFAACSQNDGLQEQNSEEVLAGQETYASFSFNVAGTQGTSRAVMSEQTVNENAVTDGRMLIFDDASGLLINNEEVSFTTDKAKTVKTTSGSRRIFVFAGTKGKDLDTKLSGLTVNTATLTNFYAVMTDGKFESGTDKMGVEFESLFANAAFVMSNVADANAVKTLAPGISAAVAEAGTDNDASNSFTFDVYRSVAKGNLAIQLKEDKLETADGIFQLSSVATYGVRNVNRSTMLVQQYGNDDLTLDDDAYSDEAGLRPQAAFYNVFDAISDTDMEKIATFAPYYYGGYAIEGTDAKSATIRKNSETKQAGPTVYFSENSNNKQVRGNSTYYGITTTVSGIAADEVAATFTYDADLKTISTEAADMAYSNPSGNVNFWYLREVPATIKVEAGSKIRRVFLTSSAAFNALVAIFQAADINLTTANFDDNAALTGTALETAHNGGSLNADDMATIYRYLGLYEGGKSYYRLNIYETTTADVRRHLVRRNHFYNATVTSFATIGEPEEKDLNEDPEKPIDADATNVSATIEVIDWQSVEMEDDL